MPTLQEKSLIVCTPPHPLTLSPSHPLSFSREVQAQHIQRNNDAVAAESDEEFKNLWRGYVQSVCCYC